jgi:hypothetical protein
MSPINGGECPLVVNKGDYYFCGDYENRPKECVNHKFDCQFCPVGLNTLRLKGFDAIKNRIDIGYSIIKQGIER